MNTVTIRWVSDDYVEILVDGTVEVEVDHDNHGRDGIDIAITTARRFAVRAGAQVVVEGVPNSDA